MSATEEIGKLREEAAKALRAVVDGETLEKWRIRYLGTKGALKAATATLKALPPEQKRDFGKLLNEVKNALTTAYKDHKAGLGAGKAAAARAVDMTLPGTALHVGCRHIISQTIEEITEILGRMGFSAAYGPEVEDERHNFNALNIPPAHPARDALENFYISPSVMLRSQTSTVQIRTMENQSPHVRIISPGRVYRPDTVDATHSFMFHQLEGLYVDEGVTMADLKSDLCIFCKAYFGSEIQTRFRPSFFPFTEPSAEVDLLFHFDDGSSDWIELGGAGMVDPNVLAEVGYDSETHTGYAFGLGIERMVMRKHNIRDIRLLFESDVRFLHQF